MVNDTSTLSGSLDEMKDQLISELGDKGVTATFDSSTGLLGLVSKIGDIQTGGGGGATNIAQGTFTTGSSYGASSLTLNYSGTGYPIFVAIWVDGGAYNNGTGGNTTWYNSMDRYDVGVVILSKSRTNETPTYATSGDENTAIITYIYKNSTSTATTYGYAGVMNNNSYVPSNTSAAANNNMIRFKGNGKTLSYYVGNRGTSSRGLARSTKFAYIVIYSE